MGIQTPGYRLSATWDLPNLRRRLYGAVGPGRKAVESPLTLTSMIDMMSVVIIFLMQTYSATGDVLMRNPEITLPDAMAARELRRSPIISVMADKVTVEGLSVGNNQGIEDKIEETDWELPELSRRLEEYKRFFESMHQGAPFPAEVIVQADKKLDFIYIKRVMFTLTKIGFPNINLAVQGASTGPAVERNPTPGGR